MTDTPPHRDGEMDYLQRYLGSQAAVRFPQLPFPDGWAAAAFSREVQSGRVHRARLMGRDIVIYRTRTGTLRVASAFCPHLGAHLGHGGRVRGDDLVCPFHGFAFGPDGSCAATGYGTTPPKARLTLWPVHESLGLVFVWYHHQGLPPQWFPPTLDEQPQAAREHTMAFASHPQEVLENAIDIGHLTYIHNVARSRTAEPFTTDSHRAHVAFTGRKRLTTHGPGITASVTIDLYGQSLTIAETHLPATGLRIRVIGAITVDEPGHIQLRTRVNVHPRTPPNPATRLLSHLVTRAVHPFVISDLRQDQRIWSTKTYLTHPRLAPGDGPVMRYRHWAGQFYGSVGTVEGTV